MFREARHKSRGFKDDEVLLVKQRPVYIIIHARLV